MSHATRFIFLVAIASLLSAGCETTQSTPARSTRLQYQDFEYTSEHMAASLAASRFLAGRNPQSPRAAIVINRVENLTTDIISIGEQWMWMAKVADSLPIREMEQNKNIIMVVEPERFQSLREMGFTGALDQPPITPTHVMTATFYSSERAPQVVPSKLTKLRSNYYYLQYDLTELQTRKVVWSDAFEFQREAAGTVID